ncbi:MAG: hypothetical protein QOK19_1807 [Solirubrobacteraceae bacterium]|jgi:hypothetical protein|nr:hypothetical protein [Solirubrobacteraceae bacterium]
MGIERLVFPRPTEQYLKVARVPVEEKCPRCSSSDVARYPIANHIGPKMITRCQSCFEILALDTPEPEDNWPPFKPATLDWDASRAG